MLLESTTDGFIVSCPGCKMPHHINTIPKGDKRPMWSWDESEDKPSFTPSILVRYPYGDPPVDQVCHSYIRDGNWQFLNDCTHELKGKTVPMIEFSWG